MRWQDRVGKPTILVPDPRPLQARIRCALVSAGALRDTGLVAGDDAEFELIDTGDDGDWIESTGTASEPEATRWARCGLAALVLLLVGMWLGSVLTRNGQPGERQQVSGPSESDPNLPPATPATTATAMPTTTLTAPATSARVAGKDSTVGLLPGSIALQGEVALAQFATHGRDETVWVVSADRLAARSDVPLAPGDWPHYLLFSGNHIAFTSPPDAFLLKSSLDQPAERVTDARYLIPGAIPGMVWAVNDAIDAVTSIDTNTGETVGEIALRDGIRWVSAAIAEGFLVNPVDADENGRWAYWTQGAPMTPIELPAPDQSGIQGWAGNTLVAVSPGPLITAIDITNDTRTQVGIDIGEGLVVDVCMSPDQRYAIIVGSTGQAAVVDFQFGAVVAILNVGQQLDAVGWTSNTQVVHIVDATLVATDMVTNDRYEVARLAPGTNWSVAGSAAMC